MALPRIAQIVCGGAAVVYLISVAARAASGAALDWRDIVIAMLLVLLAFVLVSWNACSSGHSLPEDGGER